MTAREAILSLLQGGDPPPGEYDGWRSVIEALRTKRSAGQPAVQRLYDQLYRSNPALAALMNAPQENEATGNSADSGIGCPPLPRGVQVDPALGITACPLLDEYIAHSRKWAPEAFEEAHEICFLFVLSAIAARRIFIPFGLGQYTSLTLAMVARTTVYTKTTAFNLARDLIREIGLSFLLGPDRSTPEKMISDMAGKIDLSGYDKWTSTHQEYTKKRLAFMGQRAWLAEEFGMHLNAMMQEGGTYAALAALLRQIDDCPPTYLATTVGRGDDYIEKPYLPVLANMTPADMRKGGKRGSEKWGNGDWARFGFASPLPGDIKEGRFPDEEYTIPENLKKQLKTWHTNLGIPEVDIESEVNDKGKLTGQFVVLRTEKSELPIQRCKIARDVIEALYRYRYALKRMANEDPDEDKDGNYGRFSTIALRISGLFASVEHAGKQDIQPEITMKYWARAQAITERMRASLHRLLDKIEEDTATPSYSRKAENKIVETILKLEKKGMKATLRNIYTYGNLHSAAEAEIQVQGLIKLGILEEVPGGRSSTYRVARQEASTA